MITIPIREPSQLKQKIKPSKFCKYHPDKPVTARGLCKNCYDKWLKINNPEYLERQKQNCKNWLKKNRAIRRLKDKEWRAKKDKNYNLIRGLSKYNLTLDDYNFMLSEQNGVCAICGKPAKEGKRLHIDHDHETDIIRGLLCFRCNFGLTYFSENPKILQKATEYIANGPQRGQELVNTLNAMIDNREKNEPQFTDCNTKFISNNDKQTIIELHNQGMKLIDIVKEFPQYSRSAIFRTYRNNKNEPKQITTDDYKVQKPLC